MYLAILNLLALQLLKIFKTCNQEEVEEEQQEMNKGPDNQTLPNSPLSSGTDETSLRTEPRSKPRVSKSLK